MSFSSPETQGAAREGGPQKEPDLGQRLGSYFQNKYPIAGGLLNQVFPGQQPQQAIQPPVHMSMGENQVNPNYEELIVQNSKPKTGGGLQALLSLIGV